MNCAHVMLVDHSRRSVALLDQAGELTLPRLTWQGDESADIAALLDRRREPTADLPRPSWIDRLPPLTVLATLAQASQADAEAGSAVPESPHAPATDAAASGVATATDGAASADTAVVPGRSELYLCEPRPGTSLAAVVDGWWSATDPDPPGVAPELATATRHALAYLQGRAEADGRWPFFSLPGASATLADIVTTDPAAAAVATLGTPAAEERPTDLRQLRGWWLSSVWHNEDVVLKVTHPNWHYEPAVTALLSTAHPEHVERPLTSGSVRPAGHGPTPWMIQRRVRSAAGSAGSEDDRKAREQRLRLMTVAALARIQLTFEGREAELTRVGAPDRTITATRTLLPFLWASPELDALEPAEKAALPRLERSILERLDALEASGSTPLLVHGDLHLGNVIDTGTGALTIIDWTDAALSWAGVDLLTLLPPRADAERREAVIAAYEAALGDRLGPAVRPGLDLADVFHAISYARIEAFLPLSGRWELGGTVRYLVKRQLEQVMG